MVSEGGRRVGGLAAGWGGTGIRTMPDTGRREVRLRDEKGKRACGVRGGERTFGGVAIKTGRRD